MAGNPEEAGAAAMCVLAAACACNRGAWRACVRQSSGDELIEVWDELRRLRRERESLGRTANAPEADRPSTTRPKTTEPGGSRHLRTPGAAPIALSPRSERWRAIGWAVVDWRSKRTRQQMAESGRQRDRHVSPTALPLRPGLAAGDAA
eukprot:TRINITY_DN5721_c0_g2_i1.p2 TRINITY_DN5721_c0_g2~~TRINITY_DN5721_c0_g2_i1.p2  ORF type:complete len:171 (+),score=25.77 TRINITY_DN5721_c0_g2_i1:68-514(+)